MSVPATPFWHDPPDRDGSCGLALWRVVGRLSFRIGVAIAGLSGLLMVSQSWVASAQDLIPFTPSSSAGTLYIGHSTAGSEPSGVSIGVRITDPTAAEAPRLSDGLALGSGGDRTMVTGGAIVDVYPFSSGLRLSGGVRFGASGGPVIGEPGAVTVGGETYPAALVTSPDGPDVDGLTPYVGVGYGTTLFDGTIDLSIDAGALTAVPGTDGLSVSDRLGTADPDVGDFLPMVGVSATYRF